VDALSGNKPPTIVGKMRHSLYWDNFANRVDATVAALKEGTEVPVSRVAIFITNKCNLACSYCNHPRGAREMSHQRFETIIRLHPRAIIHITGGEPSSVRWLYPFLEENKDQYSFHLNTNAVRKPPFEAVKRLKISLDSANQEEWEALVGRKVFRQVVDNIKEGQDKTVISITCTVTKQNIQKLPEFARFCKTEFPHIYAIFFSIYKGNDPRFSLEEREADLFFEMRPELESLLNTESIALMGETIEEKKRLLQGIRFPENKDLPCYISLSERVFDWKGESACSHLYRDGQLNKPGEKHPSCLYGCNRRLISFNQEVERRLNV